jgi:hypothetical protein
LTEREKQKLQVWSRIMPYREPFAWAMIPLFENNNTSAGAAADGTSPSSPLATSVSGSSSQDSILENVSKMTLDGKFAQYSSGSSIIVEVSNLNKVKECYTEDSLQVSILLSSQFSFYLSFGYRIGLTIIIIISIITIIMDVYIIIITLLSLVLLLLSYYHYHRRHHVTSSSSMLSDWVSFLAYPSLFGIKGFVVVDRI